MTTPIRTTATTEPTVQGGRGWPLWLRCLVAAVGMMLTAASPALVLVLPPAARALDRSRSGDASGDVLFWTAVTWVLPTVAALVLVPLIVRVEGLSPRRVLAPRGFKEVPVGVAVAAGIALVVALASALAQLLPGGSHVDPVGVGLPAALVLLLGIEKAFLLQGIPEELWFRGFGWRGRGRAGWATLVATTLTFTVLHLVSAGGQQSLAERFLYLVLPLGLGLCAGALRWCLGSTGAAVGVHGGTHTGLLALVLLPWRSGPASWVVVGAALMIVAAVALVWRRPWRYGASLADPRRTSR